MSSREEKTFSFHLTDSFSVISIIVYTFNNIMIKEIHDDQKLDIQTIKLATFTKDQGPSDGE